MQSKFLVVFAIAVTPLAALGQSGDAGVRNLASACAICHGTDGRAVTGDVIGLAGLPKEHIAGQMQAFRDGKRPATVMHQIAKGYSNEQIAQLAAYFAAQKR